jgi:hypothetical protein
MTTVIKTKNSTTTTTAPSSLAQGELAVNITDKKLWVGNAATTPVQIAGNGFSPSYGALTATSITDSGLTSGRVTYATTAGLLTDSANLTFDGTKLTVAGLKDSALTSGRVTYATTSGELTDSANLTFNGTTLTANTLNLTTALGVAYGGTGLTSLTAGYIPFGTGTTAFGANSNLFWDNTNARLGVGSSTPSAKLNIVSTASTSVPAIKIESSGTLASNDILRVQINGLTNGMRMFQDASSNVIYSFEGGNVGIGTSSPGEKLDVSGRMKFSAFSTDVNDFALYVVSGVGLTLASSSSGGSTAMAFRTGNAERMRLDSSGNLGLGVTPSAWNTGKALSIYDAGSSVWTNANGAIGLMANGYYNSGWKYQANGYAMRLDVGNGNGTFSVSTAPSGTAGTAITFTQAMTLDASGNLLVGTTSSLGSYKIQINATGSTYGFVSKTDTSTSPSGVCWNAATTGDNSFILFGTEGTYTGRGSISYNRTGGLTAYNTTSDYRAKTVKGSVENALSKVALLKPCTGRMNDAEIDIDFFVAHELQKVVPSAVTGEKDAVNEDGTPKYQMVDKSALIPLLTAAIQELKAEVDSLKAQLNK